MSDGGAMTIFLGVLILIIWLNVGILAERSMGDLTGGSELPHMVLPLRVGVILLAPILFLIYERHLFYKSKRYLADIEDFDKNDC